MARRTTTTAAVTAVALLGLVGCAGGGDDAAPSNAAHDGAAEPAVADAPPDELAEQRGLVEQRDASGGGESDRGSGGLLNALATTVSGRHIAIMVELTVATEDVADAAGEAVAIATSAGGFVANERLFGDDRASLTLRVPTEQHEGVVASLSDLGEVTDRSRSTQDVTGEVVDTESRIESQRTSIGRLRALLAEATALSDIIAIESELARREADLDALLSRQEQLSALTSMATITLSLQQPDTESDDDDRGFLAGLARGWDAFLAAGAIALTIAGAVVPFLVLLALLGIPVWLLLRRYLRNRSRSAPDQPPAPADAVSNA